MVTRLHFQKLVARARMLPPLAAAVVYPADRDALQLALSGSFAGYLAPTLVGPEPRIRDVANRAGIDISRLPIVDCADEPRAAAVRAADLARSGKVSAIIKGSLSDGDLLAPIAAPESGLRTESRLSHAYFIDLPGHPRWLLLADALLNVAPNLAAKKDIVQNTARLAIALGVAAPNVALLAAMDSVSPAFSSTADAVALKAMAAEGMFRGVILDGPLTPDAALSGEAARQLGLQSEVAGRADALIAPTMEAAIMVLRTLTGLTGGLAAGIVLGARVPIVAPARSDSMETRMASCVLASLAVNGVREMAAREAQAHSSSIVAEAAARAAA
jgi:phosphate acetyltransferase